MREEEIYNDGAGHSYGIPIAERSDPASMMVYSERLALDLKDVLLHAPNIATSGQVMLNKTAIQDIYNHIAWHGPYTYMIHFTIGSGGSMKKDTPIFLHITGLKRGVVPGAQSASNELLGYTPDVQLTSYGGSSGAFTMRYYVFATILNGFSMAVVPTTDFTVPSGGRAYYVAVSVSSNGARAGLSVVGSGTSPTPRGHDITTPEGYTAVQEVTATEGPDGVFEAVFT